jgi:anthranilate synthase/aminodeoxychorismate synthase-like glutamine amidotransferase
MIDNYDSFTHNLARYLAELGHPVQVFRNDAISVQALADLQPSGILLSPGPGCPDTAGITLPVIERFAGQLPILGVCLGHQALAQVFGAHVVRAPEVMHGKRSTVESGGEGLFRQLPPRFKVTRYHSLVVDEQSLPAELLVDARVSETAKSPDIMALRHRHWPVFGVQFHPESVSTQHGHALLAEFCQLAGLSVADHLPDAEYA